MAALMALIVGAFGVIATILWRLNSVADSAKGLAETAHDLSNLSRRWSWRGKANADKLRIVDDPRVGATALMVAIAQADGAMTAAERAMILAQAQEKFDCTPKVAEEMLGYGRFLIGTSHDPDESFRKLLPLFAKACGPKERTDIVAMVRAVASAEHAPGEAETATLARIERALK